MNERDEYANIGEYIKAVYPKHYESVHKKRNSETSLKDLHKIRLKMNADDFEAKIGTILQEELCH